MEHIRQTGTAPAPLSTPVFPGSSQAAFLPTPVDSLSISPQGQKSLDLLRACGVKGAQVNEFVPAGVPTDFCALISGKAQSLMTGKPSWSAAANELLSAYAQSYDEIVQMYENGENLYTYENAQTCSGCRKLTQDEAIAQLDYSFEKLAVSLEERAKESPQFYRNIAESYKSIARASASRPEIAAEWRERAANMERQAQETEKELSKIGENMSGKIIAASKELIRQYILQAMKQAGASAAGLAGGIPIF